MALSTLIIGTVKRSPKIHKKCEIPKKKSKNNPLTEEDKELNMIRSSSRISVEHINAKMKVFQIFTQKYRNRRKRFSLRLNLICGLINFDRGVWLLSFARSLILFYNLFYFITYS